jgi:hypothetical protein
LKISKQRETKHKKVKSEVEEKMANMNAYLGATLVLIAVLAPQCSGSAIPMWEYLSSGEKVSTWN